MRLSHVANLNAPAAIHFIFVHTGISSTAFSMINMLSLSAHRRLRVQSRPCLPRCCLGCCTCDISLHHTGLRSNLHRSGHRNRILSPQARLGLLRTSRQYRVGLAAQHSGDAASCSTGALHRMQPSHGPLSFVESRSACICAGMPVGCSVRHICAHMHAQPRRHEHKHSHHSASRVHSTPPHLCTSAGLPRALRCCCCCVLIGSSL